MAIQLSSISSARTSRPPRIIVYGPHKIGKSTFGASAPSPIFVRTEDGLDNIDVPAFPLAKTFDDVLGALRALRDEAHEYKTVVVDSLDWLEPLVWAHTARKHDKADIEAFGYGKGYMFASDTWREFLTALDELRDTRGMAIICLAHHQIKRFDAPDTDPYDRYSIKLHERASGILQEWANVIGFAQIEVATVSSEVGFNRKITRGEGTGRRVLHLVEKPAFQAGNQYGLPDSVVLSWEAFAQSFQS